jgi:hypothetical protein
MRSCGGWTEGDVPRFAAKFSAIALIKFFKPAISPASAALKPSPLGEQQHVGARGLQTSNTTTT